ncbi:hypothetical protein JVU11DRAFT_2343 [Chiua virens]|nr:hypothetical protein JVU11DRAFT_2343 [Chiua virens]
MSPASTRREAAARPREPTRPLMTREPLAQDRERKPAPPSRKKRKAAPPTKPVMTFDPTKRHVPCGRQDSPVSPSTPIFSGPPEPFTSSYVEQHIDPCVDHDIPGLFHDGHDAPRQSRVFPEHASTGLPGAVYPDTPCTEVNDMSSAPEAYDSPESYTSSSSPAPSDQSPAEFPPHPGYTHQAPPSLPMYPGSYVNDGSYVHQPAPVVHQQYTYPMDATPDRHAQNFPVHYDSPYSRASPHGGPGNNGYHYTPRY